MQKLFDDETYTSMREIAPLRRRRPVKRMRRSWKAAKLDRLNADWLTGSSSVNTELRQDLKTLRVRARDAVRNEPLAARYIGMVESNVIGQKGIQLQGRARDRSGKLNAKLNKSVEEAFWLWGAPETCTVSGRMGWIEAQRFAMRTIARDGEVLVQMVPADNAFGFSLKFIDADYLDEKYSETLRNGNRVIMSVEIDANNKPVAYYLTTPSNRLEELGGSGRTQTRTRIPASEIVHVYFSLEEEGQTRGSSWFAPVLLQMKHAAAYDEGVITQARMTANVIGFLETIDAEAVDTSEYDDDEELPPVTISTAPLAMNELPPNMRLSQLDPKQPTQNHAAFKKTLISDIATGLHLNYFSLAGDLSAVNYSSARVGLGEERERWRSIQDEFSMKFCRPIYHAWLKAAVKKGVLKVNALQFAELQNPMWRARGWRYVDPQKEIKANADALAANLTTYTDVLADQGVDINEMLETRQQEIEMAKGFGIDLTAKTPEKDASEPEKDETDDPDEPQTVDTTDVTDE